MAAQLWYQSAATQQENKLNKDKEDLEVFGYACKLFRDDEKALYIDRGAHLIPWMGDDRLQIDRYDGRGHLYDLTPYDGTYITDTRLSEEEKQMESLCDEERYLELRKDIAEQNMYEEEEWKRYYESLSEGYNAVGFSYDYHHGNSQQAAQQEVPVEEKPFIVSEDLQLPPDIPVPETQKANAIIEKTAKFIAEHGAQMEIIMKTKQANNPQFTFLHFDDELNPYYKHMVKMIKSGKYKLKEVDHVNSDHDSSYEEDHPDGYLHPSLMSSRVSPTPDVVTKSVKMPAVSIHDTPYGQLIKSLKKNTKQHEKSSEPQDKKPQRELPAHVSQPQTQHSYMSQPEFGPSHPDIPPPPGLEPVTLPSAQPPPPGIDVEGPQYPTGRESPESEDSSSRDSPLPSLPGLPKIVPPPPDVQPVIDRMAMYVAKNGEEFEIVVKSKNDPRFEFLETYHMHFPYYNFKKQIHITETAKERKRIENERRKGVSFSIKAKSKEPEGTSRMEKRQVFDDNSSDEEGRGTLYKSDLSGTSTPVEPKEWCQGLDDRPSKVEMSQDALEKKQAEERLKDKLAAAAREKLVQASKEKQMQAERKRKAAMFINMLKSTNPAAGSEEIPRDLDETGNSSNTPLGSRSQTPVVVEEDRLSDFSDRSSRSSRKSRQRSPSPKSRRSPSPKSRSRRRRSRSPWRRRRSPTPPSAYSQIRRSPSSPPNIRPYPVSPVRRRERSRSPYIASPSRSPKSKSHKRTRSPSPRNSRYRKDDSPSSHSAKKSKKKKRSRYQSLHTAIIHNDEYSPILVNDHAPGEPNRRFDYVKGLVVPAKCVKYTYTGSKEHLVFLWKVPESASESEILNKNAEISAGLLKTLPKYHTRAMRREFMSLFGKSIHNKAAFLREAYRRLTGDCSASLTADEAEVDKRVTEILENEDSDLIWDLRVNNQGQPEKYLGFLEECQKYISEKVELAVDERRHDKVDSEGDVVTHLAQAFSIRDLHEQVIKSAPPGTRIPSKEWLRFQFWPRNCHFKTAQKYTGKLKIKFMVQSRQFRKNHADMHYASALFRYEKEFAMKYKEHCSFVCMDDKHKVKVGAPGYPVAMVDRGKSVLVAMGKRFEVADHDFTKFSLTPSVNLLVNIPNSIEETFYGGTVYVGFKENCFEPSSPWRHAAELNSVLDLKNDKPILLMYCDGGPDHRLTYASVQMSLITLFLKRNLDMVIAVRTPPGNSWKNPAERIMSILNLGFQSVGIMRQPMPTLESKVNNLSSIGEIRNFADKEPLIREEIKDSMEPVKVLLSNVVHRLQWKGQHLKTFAAASDTAENNLRSAILDVDPDLIDGSTTKNELKGKKQFHSFLSSHCKIRHYMFCVKKCGKATCTLCKPPNLSADVFESLNFLPDPEPDGGDRYKSFDQLYGHETSEKFRPSLDHAPGSGHGMPYAPTAQTAKNVEMVIYCSECEKPRVIYSKHVVRGKKRKELQDVLSDLSYTCGSAFADVETEQDNILKSVHVRRNVSCALPVELAYFSAGFEPVCFHCGQEENLTVFEDKYPICQNCETDGKVCVVKRGRCNKT